MVENLGDVIKLTASQYQTLKSEGTITVGGVTYSYNASNIYLVDDNTIDIIYPIGVVYLSVDSTSPASLFGGTWEYLGMLYLSKQTNPPVIGSTSLHSTVNFPVNFSWENKLIDGGKVYNLNVVEANDGTTYLGAASATDSDQSQFLSSDAHKITKINLVTDLNTTSNSVAVYAWKRVQSV